MPNPAIDITPEGSAVPVFLEEPTAAEITQRQTEATAQAAAKTARETVRTSALAKLAALGLTEEEIAVLIGGI
jgi:DNA-binding NarL/FixJ family response regulator